MKALAIVLLLASGCIGYRVKNGPAFKPAVAPAGTSLVYLYRPAKLVAWARPMHVLIAGKERIVMVEGYAVLALPPGHYDVIAYSSGAAQNYVTVSYGGTDWKGSTSIDVVAGAASYVLLEGSLGHSTVTAVSEHDALPDIRDLGLSAGGELR